MTLEEILNDPTIEAVAVETDEIYLLNEAEVYDYNEFGIINQLRGMEFTNVVTADDESIEDYFRYVLGYPVRFTSEERAWSALISEQFVRMPSYPEEGYMAYIDGILMIKMQPNKWHIEELARLEALDAENISDAVSDSGEM